MTTKQIDFSETFKNEQQLGDTITIVCFDSKKNSANTFPILSKVSKQEEKEYQNFLASINLENECTDVFVNKKVALVGIKYGANPEFNVRNFGGKTFQVLKSYGFKNFNFTDFEFVKFLREGLILASYKFDIKTLTFQPPYFFEGPEDEIFAVKAQNFSRFLMDLPSNLLNPTDFVDVAKAYVKFLTKFNGNVSIEVYDEEFMREKTMGLLLSVNAGSHQPAKLIKITYKGNPKESGIDYSFVGKGVTFDTGGIWLKGPTNMHQMKSDMGGAAVCLASLGPIVQQNLPVNMTIVLPMVTNMIGGNATKPGDVVQAMNGKYVEIINTDAEGRLILADALTFAQLDSPKNLIDLATLTGAIIIALGENYTGFFSNHDELSNEILLSSKKVGEMTWRMPLNDEAFFAASKSYVANFANIGPNRPKGASGFAASFLNQFIENNTPWVHWDICSTLEGGDSKIVYGPGTSGRPTLSVIELVKRYVLKN